MLKSLHGTKPCRDFNMQPKRYDQTPRGVPYLLCNLSSAPLTPGAVASNTISPGSYPLFTIAVS